MTSQVVLRLPIKQCCIRPSYFCFQYCLTWCWNDRRQDNQWWLSRALGRKWCNHPGWHFHYFISSFITCALCGEIQKEVQKEFVAIELKDKSCMWRSRTFRKAATRRSREAPGCWGSEKRTIRKHSASNHEYLKTWVSVSSFLCSAGHQSFNRGSLVSDCSLDTSEVMHAKHQQLWGRLAQAHVCWGEASLFTGIWAGSFFIHNSAG